MKTPLEMIFEKEDELLIGPQENVEVAVKSMKHDPQPQQIPPQAFYDAIPPVPCVSCAGKRFWVPVGEEKLICVKCSPPEFVSLRQYEVEIVEAFEGERYFAKVGRAPAKNLNNLADTRASGHSNAASEREGRAAAKGRRCLSSGFLVGSEAYERWLERSSASWARVQERSLLGGSRRKPALKDGQCRKCHGLETKAVPIHNGKSERFDCARCGAFVSFGRWAGSDLQAVDYPQFPVMPSVQR